MTCSGRLSLVLAAALGAMLAGNLVPAFALPGGGNAAELEEHARALRKKAEDLRAAGSLEDAAEIEKKAAACEEKATALRAEEARRAEAKAAWREAEELYRGLEEKKRGDGPDAELERVVAELREKARALREKGSVEDAEHLEGKAERLEKALALRREANELERRGKEAKEAGRGDEARELMEASERAWRQSEEILRGPGKEGKGDPEVRAILRGSPDEARRRIEGLRIAARTLRDTGMPERADAFEKQAAVAERELEGRKDADAQDVEAMKAEMERLRRRLSELEEEIHRRAGR